MHSILVVEQERIARAFLEACQHGTHPSYRARINIIGQSGAGKTSLTRRLLEQKFQMFQMKEESTDGIETHRIEFDLMEGDYQGQIWQEAELKPEKLVKIFSEDVLESRSSENASATEQHYSAYDSEGSSISENVIEELQAFEAQAEIEKEREQQAKEAELMAKEKREREKEKEQKQFVNQLKMWFASKMSLQQKQTQNMFSGIDELHKEEMEPTKGVLRLWDFGGQRVLHHTSHVSGC